ncbi:MAG: DUF370 domain-containing protein [Oscillospiraceae bacterium]|nr:DUF370 domain-containing protein [Oscillospiraceae bacterium]
MYIHLGQNVVVPKSGIIGIFDLDNCTSSRISREFLAGAEKRGEVVDISGELPRVFAVYDDGEERRIYLSQISSSTLMKRWEAGSPDAGEPDGDRSGAEGLRT